MDTEVLVREILEMCGSPLLGMTADRDKVRRAALEIVAFADDRVRREVAARDLEIKGLRAVVRKLRQDKRVAAGIARYIVKALAL